MFSSALKSLNSNISSNYSISPDSLALCGPWRIHNGKKKSTGKEVSIFIFDRKSLEPQGGSFGSRGGAATLKRAHDEVFERLKREAGALARLRHPSILELAEPVEETRNGGLLFATEPVTGSLAGILEEKDEAERQGGIGGRSSKYVIEDPDGRGRRRREVEIDELEIQKGLLQVAKGLEFLHESAGLVHANLTPEAIFVNTKSDWKISGLGFASPPDNATSTSSMNSMSLAESLNYDARLPRWAQLNLDYTSPDFVLDTNITPAADMFSLGLVIIALYNSPHKSPLETGLSISTYKRIFASSSSTPTPNNNFLCSQSLPRDMTSSVLPRLITRRPAQRVSAREFQQAQYFDNILVSTMRFLDSLPAKSPNEKTQFLRGLPRILAQFPKSVLEKKVLPALLDETKDYDLLSLILQNVFTIVELVTNGKRAFAERVLPTLQTVFLANTKKTKNGSQERNPSKESGLAVLLENMMVVTTNCSGKEFKDCILPMYFQALDSPTHSLVATALQKLPLVLAMLDFSTAKNELFPIIATVFSKTSSMAIKIKGLEALNTLCGGSNEKPHTIVDNMDWTKEQAKTNFSSAILDKYTVQEKVVPLLKGIKTKEPAVMMAALAVLQQVGKIADSEFLALEALPCLWQFALGPLLNIEQFQAFMALIKGISARIEHEQNRKLAELPASNGDINGYGLASSRLNGGGQIGAGDEDVDFESLVSGRQVAKSSKPEILSDGWGNEDPVGLPTSQVSSLQGTNVPATFSWSTPSTATNGGKSIGFTPNGLAAISRAVTPDTQANNMSQFPALIPMRNGPNMIANPQSMAPLHHLGQIASSPPLPALGTNTDSTSINWPSVSRPNNTWSQNALLSITQQSTPSPSAPSPTATFVNFKLPPPPGQTNHAQSTLPQAGSFPFVVSAGKNASQKQGFDKYESLI